MRIGIEADRIWANRFGTGRFIREIVQALQADYPQHEYILFSLTHAPAAMRRAYAPARLLRGLRRFVWLQANLPLQAARRKLDVLFCPDYLTPWWRSCPVVTVIHDLVFATHPEWGEQLVNWQLRLCMPAIVQHSTRIITPSEASRRELIEVFRCAPERVRVVPEGVSAHFRPIDQGAAAATLSRYQMNGRPFLLSVGMWSPRKNLTRLLQAFAQLRSWYAGQLVLIGGGGWSQRPLRAMIQELGLEDRVRVMGFIPDEDLPAFYSRADVFVFPSLYEGFGLPVLEAMACGCPVVTSNVSSLPEVAGEAALLVDPLDVSQVTAAMRAMIQDQGTQEHYRQAGFRRAHLFSWGKTASVLEGVFQEIGYS